MSVRVVLMVAVFGSITWALDSPCPDLFRYDSKGTNRWSGTVTLLSDRELHGVWIRVIFDGKLEQLAVDGNFGEVVPSNNSQEYLIKNRHFLLKADTPVNIKITATYEGDATPNLIGYRLNAEMVCSANSPHRQYFTGDLSNKAFLSSLESKVSNYEFEGCGTAPLSNNELENEKAEKGQWPWQASIYIEKDNNEVYVCQGTLISSQHILTAAHCVTYLKSESKVPPYRYTIYLGRINSDRNEGEKFRVKKIVTYPGYRSKDLLNDLAIVQLDKAVVVDDYVRPICLRSSSDKKEGFLVGYGINWDHEIEDLAQAKVKIINDCSKESDLKGLLTDNVSCASYLEENSLCVGDSGSSLATLREETKPIWELKGVVTVGVELQNKNECNPSSTVFFVNTANYLSWIQTVIS